MSGVQPDTPTDPARGRGPWDIPDITLVEFLRTRLDEDERVALAVRDRGPWRYNPRKQWIDPDDHRRREEGVFTGPPGADATNICGTGISDHPEAMARAEHIARHDPARVLAEVEAKRAVLDRLTRIADDRHFEDTKYAERLATDVLRLLALPYAQHAEYRAEWSPPPMSETLPDLTVLCPSCHLMGAHPFEMREFAPLTVPDADGDPIEIRSWADPPTGTPVIDRTCTFCQHAWTRSL